jgi:hypothetical protein
MIGLLLGLVGWAGSAAVAAPAADKGGDGPYAATPLDVTIPGAPLQVVVRPSGSYSVYRNNVQQFYGGYAEGVYLWVNGVVWGPEAVPAGNSVNQYTLVSNTMSGAGTRANPWVVTTVLDVGNTGLRLTQQVSYVNGDEYIRNNWAVCVVSGAGYSNLHLFHAADLYTGGNDQGYGYYDPASGAIGGYTQARDLYQIFIPITGGSRYEEDGYSTVWDDIGDTNGPGGGFRNFYRPNDYIDNGAGLEYIFNLLVGCNSISDFVSFSNQPIIPGQTPTPVPQVRRQANVTLSLLQDPDQMVAPGGIFTYTVKVTNHGPGWAYDTSARIMLDPNVEVLDFVSAESNGYVDYLGADAVSVMFRHLEPDEGAQARIVARVRPEAAANLKISSQAQAIWSDTSLHRTWNSNTITMMVGATKDSGFHGLQQPMLTVPTGPVAAGTPILIGGDFFGQEERVTLWVKSPGGDVVDLSESDFQIADMDGVVVFFVGTTTSAPAGTYSVVAHGLTTGVEGVVTFTIR